MTIKQQGGIFGRNPTFNNVAVDGTLTVDQIVEKTAAAGISLDGVTLKDGNVVLANGKGIDFSATSGTGTSELFDDYEEGTWTPVVADASTGGNVAAGGVFSAIYTKVGRQVTVTAILLNIDTTGMTGGNSLYIRGFPFTSNTLSSDYGPVRLQNIAYQSGASVVVQLNGTNTYATVLENVTNAGSGVVSVSDISSGVGDILFSMTYNAS